MNSPPTVSPISSETSGESERVELQQLRDQVEQLGKEKEHLAKEAKNSEKEKVAVLRRRSQVKGSSMSSIAEKNENDDIELEQLRERVQYLENENETLARQVDRSNEDDVTEQVSSLSDENAQLTLQLENSGELNDVLNHEIRELRKELKSIKPQKLDLKSFRKVQEELETKVKIAELQQQIAMSLVIHIVGEVRTHPIFCHCCCHFG